MRRYRDILNFASAINPGGGAFCNLPKLVASVFAEMTKRYGMYFETIEYAVYHTEREKGNFEAFVEVLG